MTCAVARCGSQLCPDQSRQEHNRELNDLPPPGRASSHERAGLISKLPSVAGMIVSGAGGR